MGLFSKQNITMQQFAEQMAKFVLDLQEQSIQSYITIIAKKEKGFTMNKEQKEEVLIFDMLVMLRAIEASLGGSSETNYILDKFHESVYDIISDDKVAQKKFEEKIQNRYKKYYEILSSSDEQIMFSLGTQFATYFFNKKEERGDNLVFIMTSAQLFASTFLNEKTMVEELLSKYKIVK